MMLDIVVSIHAPARGATIGDYGKDVNLVVSIHAPARGATLCAIELSLLGAFQSTHPQGVRLHSSVPETNPYKFQSTHPQGVRPKIAS